MGNGAHGQLGGDCVFVVDPSGELGAGAQPWIEGDAVITSDEANQRPSARIANRGLADALYLGGKRETGVTLVYTYRKKQREFHIAVRDAYMNGTPISIGNMSGALTAENTEGWQYNAEVLSWNKPMPLEEGMEITCEIKPSACAVDVNGDPIFPQYVEVPEA